MRSFFRWPAVALVALCLFAGAGHAFAVEDIPDSPGADSPGEFQDSVTLESEADDKNITVNITMPVTPPVSSEADSSAPVEDGPALDLDPEPQFTPYSEVSLDALTRQADPDALSSVIASLFGEYTPRTQTVTEYLADGSSVTYQQYVPGVAGMDWDWLAGVGLFGLCLLSFFKIIGGVLKRG